MLRRLRKLNKRRKLLVTVQICIVAFHIAISAFGTYGKRTYLFGFVKITGQIVKLMDLLKDMVIMITNIVGSYCLCNNFKLLHMIYSLRSKQPYITSRYVYNTIVIILYLLVIFTVGLYLYFIISRFGWLAFKYVVPGIFEYCFFNFTLFAIVFFVQEIKEQIANVNGFFNKNIDLYFQCNIVSLAVGLQQPAVTKKYGVNDMCIYLNKLQYITKHHETVCDLLDTLNEKFKPLTVLIIMSVTVDTLRNITMIIEYAMGSSSIYMSNMFLFLLMMSGTIGQGGLAAWVGEQIDKEGHKTVKLCLCLSNKLSTTVPKQFRERFEKQINILLNQSKSRKICLHAGGFFQLNWGILGIIMSTVTTYSIVIIQFYASDKFK